MLVSAALLAVAGIFPATAVERYDSYKGLIMAGYQGWFNAPGDGAGRGWHHYAGRRSFAPGDCTIDFWPDTREYEKTYPSPFEYEDGTVADLFSSYDPSTVATHFRWMREYGLDGVFMQRFVAEIRNESGMNHFTRVLDSAMKAAADNERAIAVMYDLSGMQPGEEQVLLDDLKALSERYGLLDRDRNPSYLWHNGRPLVSVWGLGFNDRRAYGFDEIEKIIDGVKEMGFSIMAGVPTNWRELTDDTLPDTRLHDIIRKCDIVMPWFVGRYNEDTYKSRGYDTLMQKDIAWAAENGVDYSPLAFPGFSWCNMFPADRRDRAVSIPRNRGEFLWKQLYTEISSGAEMIYVAMFDEIDEGTAIFKCAKKVPAAHIGSQFVPIEDGIEGDHYLWLIGQAGKMLRGETPLSESQPQRNF